MATGQLNAQTEARFRGTADKVYSESVAYPLGFFYQPVWKRRRSLNWAAVTHGLGTGLAGSLASSQLFNPVPDGSGLVPSHTVTGRSLRAVWVQK